MSDEKRRVTIEDLLRLKRAERPPAEFWSEFDRQLRAKQLAALVQRRPWWSNLRDGVVGSARFHVAAGAVAVMAITFVSLRDQAPLTARVGSPEAAFIGEPSATVATGMHEGSSAATLPEEQVSAPSVSPVSFVAMVEPQVFADGPATAEPSSQTAGGVHAFEALTAQPAETGAETPSARFIAANYAAAQDTIGAALLSDVQGFEVRSGALKVAKVDPLQQMTPPGELRRSARFLTAMVSTANQDASVRTTERVASRISPEELYDQVRRFGTRQGGLNVKF